jgi:hypothetical protein
MEAWQKSLASRVAAFFPGLPGREPGSPFPISHFPALAAIGPATYLSRIGPPLDYRDHRDPTFAPHRKRRKLVSGRGYEMRADPTATAGSWTIREAPTLTQG